MKRQHWVILHRWLGLVLAAFLFVAGLTGSLLAFYRPLDEAFAPGLLKAAPPRAGALARDPLQLREQVLSRHPGLRIDTVPLWVEPGESLMLPVQPASDTAPRPDIDELYVDPFTGRELGGRLWGDASQGFVNAMPFVYRLHYSLLWGSWGTRVMGIVALLWTLDCFVGAYLTLPVKMPRREGPLTRQGGGWWSRWRRAWLVRWSGGHRTTVDLHRAGGLWLWALLFVIAWSAVSFNLAEVYRPAMAALFGRFDAPARPTPANPPKLDALDWHAARERARGLMEAAAKAEGIEVEREQSLSLDRRSGTWRYAAVTDRDIGERRGLSTIEFDAQTGALLSVQWPVGQHAGRTFTTWITSLHTARVGGTAMRVAAAGAGMVVAVLSITGVLIWARKRAGRYAQAAQRRLKMA